LQAGVDNGGYDENPIAGLAGVQCEACHGPMGPSFADHSPDVLSPLRGMACDRCHTQNEEYATSGHGSVIENAGGYDNWLNEHYLEIPSCLGCHTNEGFLIAWDEDWAGREMPHEPWQITCATCHDVHSPATDDNPAYLRGLAAVTTEYGGPDNPDGVTIDNWGNGQLCIQCHHARRDLDDITEQLELGDDYPGPHGSPQADMVLGYGCWEIEGYEYERESDHTPSLLPNMCVKCHLFSIPHVDPEGPIYGHTFAPDVRACQQCHEGAADFDIGGRRTEIQNLMTQLFNLLPNDGTELMPFDTLNWTYEQREAGYGYYFVQNEGSMGVHNYSYAKSILDNAIDYLTGDIVARRDNRIGG